MPLLSDGESISGVYTVERFLGEGAFAEVYRVQHRFLGRQAMKVFKRPAASAEEVRTSLDEALLLSRIGHPNVVRVFDANVLGRPEGLIGYFTMEYVAGGTLERYWRSYGQAFMPVTEAVEIMGQACAGIAVAHAEIPPIVHRDIKPQNILVGYDGAGLRIRVSDFGLAKKADPVNLLVSSRGTLSFKPPEAFDDMDSTAADVWALGTTLYMLLTDQLPFPELDGRDLRNSQDIVGRLRPASTFNLQVDGDLERIVAQCLAVAPAQRFGNAGALGQALANWSPPQTAVRAASRSDSLFKAAGAVRRPSDASLEKRLEEALALGRHPSHLTRAADMLEQVLNDSPRLREQYASRLLLWRRGVLM